MEVNQKIIQLLKENVIFQEFTETELEKVIPFMHEIHLGTGDFVIHQGDLGSDFYIIEEGEVEVIKRTGVGERIHQLTVLRRGDNFGELVLVGNGYRSASVRALHPTKLLALSTETLSTEVSDPRLILSIYKGLGQQLSDRLRSTNETMTVIIAAEQSKTHSRFRMEIILTVIIVSISLFTFYIGTVMGGDKSDVATNATQRIIIE